MLSKHYVSRSKYFAASEFKRKSRLAAAKIFAQACSKFIFSTLMPILLLANVYATTAAAFLDNGLSARSEGLARAFTAVADDLDAFYFNPAGYGIQTKTRVNTLFAKNRNIENVVYAGYGQALGNGYGAVNVYSGGVDGIPLTTYDKDKGRVADSGSSFSAVNRAVMISYGEPLSGITNYPAEWSWGVSLKYIQETLYKSNASGAGLDAGLLYKNGHLTCGWSVINLLEPQLTWDTGAVDVAERQQRFGLAYRFFDVFLISGELNICPDRTLTGLGGEYTLLEFVTLRAGTFTEHYALGLGFNYAGLQLDCAYLVPTDYLIEPTQKISIGYIF